MTWPLAEALRPSVINMVYKKNNETLYTSAGFIGYIGVFTGVKLGIKMNKNYSEFLTTLLFFNSYQGW